MYAYYVYINLESLSHRCGKPGLSLHSVDFHPLQSIPQIWHTDVQDRQIFGKLEITLRIFFAVQIVWQNSVCTNNPMLCCNPLHPSVLSVRVTCACTAASKNCTVCVNTSPYLLICYHNSIKVFPLPPPHPCLSSDYSGRQVVLQMQTQFL
jgi:hypothetical protein